MKTPDEMAKDLVTTYMEMGKINRVGMRKAIAALMTVTPLEQKVIELTEEMVRLKVECENMRNNTLEEAATMIDNSRKNMEKDGKTGTSAIRMACQVFSDLLRERKKR